MIPNNLNIYWIAPFIVIDLLFKGIALWKSVRHNQRNWFITLLLVNSAGIIPIIYLTLFEKKK